MTLSDETSLDRSPAPPPPDATAVDDRGRVYELTDRGVAVTTAGGVRRFVALDDPRDPAFTRLPRVDLADGRPLRTSAFLVWSAHVRVLLASGATFETEHRARRPYHTAFGIAGGLIVGVGTLALALEGLSAPRRVWIEPSPIEWLLLLAALALLVWVALGALSATGRMWLTRRGSFVRVTADGIAFAPNRASEPFANVRDAMWRPFVRCTEIEMTDGRRLVVPRESGALARLDLVLAALDDGVRDRVLGRM